MTVIDKLVYLIRHGAITVEQVAEQYREAVEAALAGAHDAPA